MSTLDIADASETTIQRSAGDDNAGRQPVRSSDVNLPSDTHYANVSPSERIASGVAGMALINFAVAKRRDLGGAAMALAGGYLLYRAASGYCPGYAALRTGSLHEPSDTNRHPNAVIPHGQGVKVEKAVTIDKPAEELYAFWRDFTNLPLFMEHLESVTVQDNTHSHWVAKAPFGKTVEWDAEIINEIPGERIAWRSTENAQIPNAGSVSFKPAPAGRGTVVKVNLEYNPPAGILGAAVAKISGEEPNQQVADDLRHFKNLMEAGEIPTVAGQPQGSKAGHTQPKPLMPTTA